MTTAPLVHVPGAYVETVGPTENGLVGLRLISVDGSVRGNGVGESALSQLCSQADDHGWTVALAATCDLGSDVRRLVRWYSRHGFTLDRAQTAMVPFHVPMIRLPQVSAAAA